MIYLEKRTPSQLLNHPHANWRKIDDISALAGLDYEWAAIGHPNDYTSGVYFYHTWKIRPAPISPTRYAYFCLEPLKVIKCDVWNEM